MVIKAPHSLLSLTRTFAIEYKNGHELTALSGQFKGPQQGWIVVQPQSMPEPQKTRTHSQVLSSSQIYLLFIYGARPPTV